MSLWTPGGEHEVPREQTDPSATGGPPPAPQGGGIPDEVMAALSPEQRAALDQMSPEERAQAEAMLLEMATVQQQMAETPAAVVVANHAMGLYELATIHLRQSPPGLGEAQIAIDAFGALVESLQGRLGPDEATLVDALGQLRLAFVQIKAAVEGQGGDDPEAPAEGAGEDAP